MTSFIGEYTCKVDTKSRIALPVAFKKQMPEGAEERFVVKKDIYEKCLILYTIEEWNRQNERLRASLNEFNREHNQFLREFHRSSVEVSSDASNRILIPSRLLEFAGIDKDVVLSGQDRKIEIWAKEAYEAKEEQADDFAALADKILGNVTR
jgi:MraZ protein